MADKIIIDKINKNSDKINISVKDNEYIQYVLLGFDDGERDIILNVEGENAKVDIIGVFLCKGNTKISIKTLQHHIKPNSVSDLLFKAVLYDDAEFDYKGLIKIDNEAQNSNAYQKNDNLVLSSDTKVDTKPELEILANQVKCSHGATIGQIDREQVFYLMSRGMSRKDAENLIIQGFLESVLDRITDKEKKDEIKREIEKTI